MIKAAIYNKETGIIDRFVATPYDCLQEQCAEGEEFFLNCPETAGAIIDGSPVDRTYDDRYRYDTLYMATIAYLDQVAAGEGAWSSMLSARVAALGTGKFANQARPLEDLYHTTWDYFFSETDLYKTKKKPWLSKEDFVKTLPKLPR